MVPKLVAFFTREVCRVMAPKTQGIADHSPAERVRNIQVRCGRRKLLI
jgi:hypothetical protein